MPEGLQNSAFYIGLIRDIALLLILAVALVAALVIYRKVSSVLGSAQRVVKGVEEVVKPAAVASRVGSRFRKAGEAVPGAAGGGSKVLTFGVVTLLAGGGILALSRYFQRRKQGGSNG